ncbi:hypothetical protein LNKW23_48720 [Paralimibaculum aggregatum]|uniref:Helix-turn-helix domain-containing protein n=1 Tax=Paralimibaculum aggregatum TaxID=3036245 RepID=A0ABQ6LUC9_9RHOB|nr:hypothetical protein [Limibaculum sp. NKW23]GMG85647.1 hypothetical protein LNKW23_48720 [Limibaculum sp. NKW23]
MTIRLTSKHASSNQAIDADAADIPEYASIATTAKLLDMSCATVWRRIADGTLESMKIGGMRRVLLRRSIARLDDR